MLAREVTGWMDRLRRLAPPALLAVAFAVWLQMSVALTGQVPAAALTTALAAGAVAVAVLAAPRPLAALRGLTRPVAWQSCIGGLLAVAGAPALIAAVRMSDAPAGSIVVFWVSGGWAAVAAAGAALLAVREWHVLSAGWSLAGALLALAGVAGIVADWERPSSFSPWVRFAPQELGMLAGGVLLLVGGLMLLHAARSAQLDAVLLCASVSAVVASLVWWGASGFGAGWSSLAERPLEVAVAAIAWGFVCSSWPSTLKACGPAAGAAALSVTPVLLSALILLEQLVGVAGPQPLMVPGVVAGSLLVLVGVFALAQARRARSARTRRGLLAVAAVPAALAAVGLLLPAILVRVDVDTTGGAFAGSWTMGGAESVAGWAAVALAVLVVVAAADARPAWPIAAALAASATWPWLLDVPTHVWRSSLSPEIQIYYGTEYGSIAFQAAPNAPTLAAVILGAVAMLAIMAMRIVRARSASHVEDGGQ
jgi:hypothetical protein